MTPLDSPAVEARRVGPVGPVLIAGLALGFVAAVLLWLLTGLDHAGDEVPSSDAVEVGGTVPAVTAAQTAPAAAGLRPELAEPFIPPSSRQGERVVLPLTFVDGATVELTFPDSLDLGGFEFSVAAQVDWLDDSCCSRPLTILHAPVRALFAGAAPTEPEAEIASLVGFYEGTEPGEGYLAFEYGEWAVLVPSDGLSREERAWASALVGAETEDGFLTLDPAPPIRLNHVDAPDGRLSNGTDSVSFLFRNCPPYPERTDRGYATRVHGEAGVSICPPGTNLEVTVNGSDAFTSAVVNELEIREVQLGRLEPMQIAYAASYLAELQEESVGLLPILDQRTGAMVFLSDDTQITVVDVDAATAESIPLPRPGGGDPPYRMVRREDQLVVWGPGAVYVIDIADPTNAELVVEGSGFFPSAAEDRVWVVTESELQEVTTDGLITRVVELPEGRYPTAAVTQGILLGAPGPSIELLDPSTGEIVETALRPYVIAALGDLAATCSSPCTTLDITNLATGVTQTIKTPDGVAAFLGSSGQFSPDGRYLAVQTKARIGPIDPTNTVTLAVVDVANGQSHHVTGSLMTDPRGLAWTSDANWIFYQASRSTVVAYHPGDSTPVRVPIELTTVGYGFAAS